MIANIPSIRSYLEELAADRELDTQLTLGAVGILLSWCYAKGGAWALWGLRIAMPLVLVAAALASPLAGSVLIIIVAAILAAAAWSGEARLAIDPLPSELPAPRPRRS